MRARQLGLGLSLESLLLRRDLIAEVVIVGESFVQLIGILSHRLDRAVTRRLVDFLTVAGWSPAVLEEVRGLLAEVPFRERVGARSVVPLARHAKARLHPEAH